MLTILGPLSRSGARMSRRSGLRIGGLAQGGLALPDILRAEARRGEACRVEGGSWPVEPNATVTSPAREKRLNRNA